MKKALWRFTAICCCLIFCLPCVTTAETQVSQAVRPFANASSQDSKIEDMESRAPMFSFGYHASASETLSYNYAVEPETISCIFTLHDMNGHLLDEETIQVRPKSRTLRYSNDLREGIYTIRVTEYDEMNNVVYILEETFYFMTNASIVVSPYPSSRGMTVATVHGKKQFDWYPVLDETTFQPISTRYRFRITAENINNRKEEFKNFEERVIVDETMRERWHVVDADLLPSGTYTVKVWAYDDGGNELACWAMTLVSQQRWTIYDYDLITDLDFTPGEAITRQHATGEKSEKLVAYDAVLPEVSTLPMTKLMVGGETLDADCSGTRFSAVISDDMLTLRASGTGTWRIRQNTLVTLAKSGVRMLRLIDSDGKTHELPTDMTFTGYQYALLRARGLVSKDFLMTSEKDGWCIKADGQNFDLMEDGTLILRSEEEESAA